MFARAKGKRIRQLQCQEQCIDHIPYCLSGLSRVHFFPQPFSKQLYTFKRLRTTRARVKIGTREEGFLPTLRVSPAIFTRAGVFRSLFYQPSLSIKIVSKFMKMSNKTVYQRKSGDVVLFMGFTYEVGQNLQVLYGGTPLYEHSLNGDTRIRRYSS